MIPQEHLDLLNSIDLSPAIEERAEGPDFGDPPTIRHHDGTPLSRVELIRFLGIPPSEIMEFVNGTFVQSAVEAVEELDEHDPVVAELKDLVEDEWRWHMDLNLQQVVDRLPEPDRRRASELLTLLAGKPPEDSGP